MRGSHAMLSAECSPRRPSSILLDVCLETRDRRMAACARKDTTRKGRRCGKRWRVTEKGHAQSGAELGGQGADAKLVADGYGGLLRIGVACEVHGGVVAGEDGRRRGRGRTEWTVGKTRRGEGDSQKGCPAPAFPAKAPDGDSLRGCFWASEPRRRSRLASLFNMRYLHCA